MTKDKGGGKEAGRERQMVDLEEVIECPTQKGYKVNICLALLLYPLAILPAGLGMLLVYWFPHYWVRLTCSQCPLDQATIVLIKDENDKWHVQSVRKILHLDEQAVPAAVNKHQKSVVKFIYHQHLRYLYNEKRDLFVLLRGLERDFSCQELHKMCHGLTVAEQKRRLALHGPNSMEVPVTPYHVLLIEEVLHPFFIFEFFSVIFWSLDSYYVYSGAVLFISVVSVLVSLIQTRRELQQLHDMMACKSIVSVLRDEQVMHGVEGDTLVPGDVLIIPSRGMTVPCDAALVTGNVIVNEAMLTGESVPVTKTPLPLENADYSPKKHKRHTLFAGTDVVQTRYYRDGLVLAVVVRPGFLTSKGTMIRSILFPKPLNIRFYWDSIKFIIGLACLAVCGFTYTILVLRLREPPYEWNETLFRAFDIITTVVPPSLPTALTVGMVYSLNRLRKKQIYCISPQRVNLCGKIKLVCFDKTGTLTEDSLDMLGVQAASSTGFSPLLRDPSQLSQGPFLYAMATCHSLTYLDGELMGDPLDMKMFLSTGWVLEEPGRDSNRFDTLQLTIAHPPNQQDVGDVESSGQLMEQSLNESATDSDDASKIQLGIIKQFTFSSELQRTSVIIRCLPSRQTRHFMVLVKGAPETILRLSRPESVPENFQAVLAKFTHLGLRVLAVGSRDLRQPWHKVERLERDAVECNLVFRGLIVMQNKLKPETPPTLSILQEAAIRSLMITGDNLLTGVAVARMSGMVSEDHTVILVQADCNNSNGVARFPSLSYCTLGGGDSEQSLMSSLGVTVQMGDLNEHGSNRWGQNGGYMLLEQEELKEKFHLALDGNTYSVIREHYPDLLNRVLVCGTVFARMSPSQKALVVQDLQMLGYGVAMCGDGANDCGALKAAHAGVSLSETEASVASPFTSKIPNISCIPILLKEGRTALVTSFSVFKFMALYSLVEFTSVAILYSIGSNLGDVQYLWVDLVLILTFAFVMGLTGPYTKLVRRRPPGTLAGIHVILSVVVQALLAAALLLAVFYYASHQEWFVPLNYEVNGSNIVCQENTIIFSVSIFEYVALVVAFSTAAPYRKPFFTNWLFMLSLAVLIPANVFLAVAPHTWWPWLWTQFQLVETPWLFKVTMMELILFYAVLAYFVEGYILSSVWMRKLLCLVRCKCRPRNRYKHILQEVCQDHHWPPPLPRGIPFHV